VVGLTEAFKPMPDKRGLYVPHKAAAAVAPKPIARPMVAVGGR
jgi:hypothetical protein